MTQDPAALPPELESRPRRVRWARKSDAGGLWGGRLFILPHIIAGVGVTCFLFVLIAWTLLGTDIPAQPISVWTSTSKKHGTSYYSTFSYVVDGQSFTGDSDISVSEYLRIAPPGKSATGPNQLAAVPSAAPLTIRTFGLGRWRYTKSASSAQTGWGQIAFITLWVTFWNGILSVFVNLLYIKPYRQFRLYRAGLPAPGVIEGKQVIRGKNTTYRLEYMFVTPDGAEHRSTHDVAKWAYEEANEGQSVTVLHFEGKAKPSVIYEFGGYRCD